MPLPPVAVRNSILPWLIAVGAGAVETLLRVFQAPAGPLLVQAGIRMLIYAALAVLVLQLRIGRTWARIALTALLGGLGMLSMVGSALVSVRRRALASADAWELAFVLVRPLHVVAVIGAPVTMFRPTANRFFPAIPA